MCNFICAYKPHNSVCICKCHYTSQIFFHFTQYISIINESLPTIGCYIYYVVIHQMAELFSCLQEQYVFGVAGSQCQYKHKA